MYDYNNTDYYIGDMLNNNSVNIDTYNTLISKISGDTGGRASINGGTPISFKMGDYYWQVVYVDPYNTDIVSVWMTDVTEYKSIWYESSAIKEYSESVLYSTVNTIYAAQKNAYPVLDNITVSPTNMSSDYKAKQDSLAVTNIGFDVVTKSGTLSTLTDKFWAPSTHELITYWEIDASDMYASDTSWLRNCLFYGPDGGVYMAGWVSGDGDMGKATLPNSMYVRPACHLSLAQLKSNACFNVIVNSDNTSMGTVSGGGEYSNDGTESATITATPSAGYAFSHWLNSAGDIVSTSATYTFTVTATDTYTAVFREYALSITTDNGGSEISTQKFDQLNTMTTYALTFTSGNYISQIQFNGGTLRDIKCNSGTFSDVGGCTAVTYYANTNGSELVLNLYNYNGLQDLVIKLYFVNTAQALKAPSGGVETTAVYATNGGEVRLTGSDLADESDTVVCMAVAYAGYQFDGWTDSDGNNLGTALSIRLTKEQVEGKVITANFSQISTNVNTETNNTENLT